MSQKGAIPKFNLKNINKKVDVKKLKEVIWKDLREKNDVKRKKSKDESIISEAGDNDVSFLFYFCKRVKKVLTMCLENSTTVFE